MLAAGAHYLWHCVRFSAAISEALRQVVLLDPKSTNHYRIRLYPVMQVCVALLAGSNPGRAFEASDLNRLTYMSAVIKEALRLCTPVPYGGTRHVVDKGGVELCGYHVPKVMTTWLHAGESLVFKIASCDG